MTKPDPEVLKWLDENLESNVDAKPALNTGTGMPPLLPPEVAKILSTVTENLIKELEDQKKLPTHLAPEKLQ